MKKLLLLSSLAAVALATVFSLAGCNSISEKHDYKTSVVRFFLEDPAGNSFATAILPISGVKIAVNSKPVFTEFDITSVELGKSDLGQFLVFQLTTDAARDLYRLTGDNQGRRLVLTINGRALGARQIDRPFGSGSIAVFAEVPDDLLPELVKDINGTSADIQKALAKQKS